MRPPGTLLLTAVVLSTLSVSGQALQLIGEVQCPEELKGQRVVLPLTVVDEENGIGPFVLYERHVLEVVDGKLSVSEIEGAEKLPKYLIPPEVTYGDGFRIQDGKFRITLYGIDERYGQAVLKRVTLERGDGGWKVTDVEEIMGISCSPPPFVICEDNELIDDESIRWISHRVDVISVGATGLEVNGKILIPAVLIEVGRLAPQPVGSQLEREPGLPAPPYTVIRHRYVILEVDPIAKRTSVLVTITTESYRLPEPEELPSRIEFTARYVRTARAGAWDVFKYEGRRYLAVSWIDLGVRGCVLRYKVWDITDLGKPKLVRDGAKEIDARSSATVRMWGPLVLVEWGWNSRSMLFDVIREEEVKLAGEDDGTVRVTRMPVTTVEFDSEKVRYALMGGFRKLWLVDLKERRVVDGYVSRDPHDGDFEPVSGIVIIHSRPIGIRNDGGTDTAPPYHPIEARLYKMAIALEDVDIQVPESVESGIDEIKVELKNSFDREVKGRVEVRRQDGSVYTTGTLEGDTITLEKPLEPGDYGLVIRYSIPAVPVTGSPVVERVKPVKLHVERSPEQPGEPGQPPSNPPENPPEQPPEKPPETPPNGGNNGSNDNGGNNGNGGDNNDNNSNGGNNGNGWTPPNPGGDEVVIVPLIPAIPVVLRKRPSAS